MLERFDAWFESGGPVALTIKETLMPVGGKGSVFFPPTFAPDAEAKGNSSYIIDDGVCLVDSVGSQANRLEPIFKNPPYRALVPQVTVQVGSRTVNLLDAGHRAADAVVRFSSLRQEFCDAFHAYRESGHSHLLARIAPTSVVFGVWDSRGTQAKVPRLVESSIRAFDVQPLTRAAQYFSAIEEDTRKELKIDVESLGDRKFPAEVGLVDNPSGRAPGGVIAKGGIYREAVLNLVALRSLSSQDASETLKLRRYILGLALIAFTAPAELYLRQGCLLCQDPDTPPEAYSVQRNGRREPLDLNPDQALQYAQAAAADFGVGQDRMGRFDPNMVKQELTGKKKKAG